MTEWQTDHTIFNSERARASISFDAQRSRNPLIHDPQSQTAEDLNLKLCDGGNCSAHGKPRSAYWRNEDEVPLRDESVGMLSNCIASPASPAKISCAGTTLFCQSKSLENLGHERCEKGDHRNQPFRAITVYDVNKGDLIER
jgi:hypothetical protein